MPSLCLLLLVLTVLVGHAVPLQQSLSDIVLGRFIRASLLQCEDNGDVRRTDIVLYHYTDKAGFDGIQASKYINKAQSVGWRDDARFGQGVYFTSLGPGNSDRKLASNNWNGTAAEFRSKLMYYFECDIDRDEMCHSKQAVDEGRDVWVFSGDKFEIDKTGSCTGRERQSSNSVRVPSAAASFLPLSFSFLSVLLFRSLC